MKVLFINTVYGKGSTGRIIRDIGQAVEKAGGQYMVAYGRGADVDDDHSYRIGGTISVYTHALLSRITDKAGFYSKNVTKDLVKFIRGYDPDVIHLHNLHGYYINIETLFDYLKKEFKGKVVWTLHDCWAFTGHCVHYTYAGCDKWKTGCHDCPEKGSYPASMVADNSWDNYENKKRIFTGVPNMTIVTVSQWLKEQAEASFLGCYPVVRVYNGVDYEVFHPLPSNIREKLGVGEAKMILSVSDGWNDRKGFGRLLAVAKHAPADWRFVIVGLDAKQIPGLPENCVGMERTWNQEELVQIYTAADVFYNPSVEETFGLVTAEAIACGTPAVVMDSTACPETLGACGITTKDLTVEVSVAAIELALQQPGQLQQSFPIAAMVAGYLALYEKSTEQSLLQ